MYSARKYITVKHTYKQKGVYKVTIKGDCDNLYGYDGDVNKGAKLSSTLVNSLWSINVPKDSTSPLKYAYGSFFGCENLRHVGYGVFHNITDCKEVPHLYDGAILSKIEPWMLYGGKKIQSISYTFENCQMLEIDPDVFKNCTLVTNAEHCFHRCDSLLSIPSGLFDSMTKLKTVNTCFTSCTRLKSVPKNLFDNCLELNDVSKCFCGGNVNGDTSYNPIMAISDFLPPLWERKPQIKNFSLYAHGCINAKNYKLAAVYGWA
mgnify:CR=1 FL=1